MSKHPCWFVVLASAISDARTANRETIPEPEGKSVLRACGLDVPTSFTVSSDDSMGFLVGKLKFPLVLKVVSDQITHKSDVGGVVVGLNSLTELRSARDSMIVKLANQGFTADHFLIEEMVPKGLEMVVGGFVDLEFGPMVMIGFGGVFIEVNKDVSFGLCPIDRCDALEMISDLRGSAILNGARGCEPVNQDAIVEALLAIGGAEGILIEFVQQISEIDINPLIVTSSHAYAVDARFILNKAK
jgi:acyl-CoA synthetase (NDP forming)